MTSPPFRDAALAHASERRYGEIVLTRPVSHSALTVLFAVIASCVVAFLACVSVTRKAHIAGVLLPAQGLIRIQPSQAGIVTSVRVREGQVVHTGDMLFVLASGRTTAQGDAEQTISRLLQARRDSIEAERGQQSLQARQRSVALLRRADDLKAESARIDEQIVLQQRRVALALQALTRQRQLQAANFVSPASVQDREAELLDQQQRLSDLRRASAASARDLQAAQADLSDQQVQAQRDQQAAARSIAAVEQDLAENDARRQAVVRAPHDGTVTSIVIEVGTTVSAGQTVATVLPAGSELQAELYAPSRAAGFVKPGMPVLLRYQAYPYQKFGQFRGQVSEVSQGPVRAADLTLPTVVQSGAGAESVYRIRARLDAQTVRAYGHDQSLKPGMALEGTVVLERRRLYEWVLEPLYSITGKV